MTSDPGWRELDPVIAELLLGGLDEDPVLGWPRVGVDADLQVVVAVLASLRAPAADHELAGEEAAMSAFRTAQTRVAAHGARMAAPTRPAGGAVDPELPMRPTGRAVDREAPTRARRRWAPRRHLVVATAFAATLFAASAVGLVVAARPWSAVEPGSPPVAVTSKGSEAPPGAPSSGTSSGAVAPVPTAAESTPLTPTATSVPTAPGQTMLTSVSAAYVWIGLANSDSVGVRFDLRAEVRLDGVVVTAGEIAGFSGGSSGFNNAHRADITFPGFSPVSAPSGAALSLTLSVRNACQGSGQNSGLARLWYNDSAADSGFGLTIGTTNLIPHLTDGSALITSPGQGPKRTIDVQSGPKCGPYMSFGTWTMLIL